MQLLFVSTGVPDTVGLLLIAVLGVDVLLTARQVVEETVMEAPLAIDPATTTVTSRVIGITAMSMELTMLCQVEQGLLLGQLVVVVEANIQARGVRVVIVVSLHFIA